MATSIGTGRRGLAAAAALALLGAGTAAEAQERRVLGFALHSSNDDFLTSEIQDRWRTGALSLHLVHGTGWGRDLPVRFGEVLEFRFRGEILSPADVDNPDPDDRPYGTSLAFGVHSHFRNAGSDIRLGAEIVFTGEQTGLAGLQESLHDAQDLPDPSAAAETEIPDATYLAVSGEAARAVPLGARVAVRPFVEGRIGDESFARVGADLLGGSLNSGGLLIRDYATGHVTEAVRGDQTGFGWVLGADIAAVANSVYLPEDEVDLSPVRGRARAGLMWAGGGWTAFLGTSYLSEEFEWQDEGQVVGNFALGFSF